MAERHYTASKTRDKGRERYSVIFRHPVRVDPGTGKTGRRVRRGLLTKDEAEADRLVGQLNELLSKEEFWSISARATAAARLTVAWWMPSSTEWTRPIRRRRRRGGTGSFRCRRSRMGTGACCFWAQRAQGRRPLSGNCSARIRRRTVSRPRQPRRPRLPTRRSWWPQGRSRRGHVRPQRRGGRAFGGLRVEGGGAVAAGCERRRAAAGTPGPRTSASDSATYSDDIASLRLRPASSATSAAETRPTRPTTSPPNRDSWLASTWRRLRPSSGGPSRRCGSSPASTKRKRGPRCQSRPVTTSASSRRSSTRSSTGSYGRTSDSMPSSTLWSTRSNCASMRSRRAP